MKIVILLHPAESVKLGVLAAAAFEIHYAVAASATIDRPANDAIAIGSDASAAATLHDITSTTSIGYIDDSCTSVLPDAQVAPNPYQAGVYLGATLPRAPKKKVDVSSRYEEQLGSGGQLTYLVDFTRITQICNDAVTIYQRERPVSQSLNASAVYKDPLSTRTPAEGGPHLANDRDLKSGAVRRSQVSILGRTTNS
jgi:iron complex outermembrane receptor protein